MTEEIVKIDKALAKSLLKPRPENSNKGTFGSVLNIAGSVDYSGAAYFSSISALKVGAGLCRLASESETITRIGSLSPDIVYLDLGSNQYGTISKEGLDVIFNIKEPSAISIGCGLTVYKPAKEFTLKFLKEYQDSPIPIVIDADAINILAGEKNKPLPLNSAITPHPAELARIIQTDVQTIQSDRIKWAKYASSELDCIVVLKGKNTVIAVPNGKTFVNQTGNSALSKGGTGDVLTGMIVGLAAQGIHLEDACALGCYLHGLTGEIAGHHLTQYSTLASDLVKFIPCAIKELLN